MLCVFLAASNNSHMSRPEGLAPVSHIPAHQSERRLLGPRRRKDMLTVAHRALSLHKQDVRARREQHNGKTSERVRRRERVRVGRVTRLFRPHRLPRRLQVPESRLGVRAQ